MGIGAPCVEGGRLYNAYHILDRGRVVARVFKHELPNDEVFDEERLFSAGPLGGPAAVPVRIGLRLGTPVCEDARRPRRAAQALAQAGPRCC